MTADRSEGRATINERVLTFQVRPGDLGGFRYEVEEEGSGYWVGGDEDFVGALALVAGILRDVRDGREP